MRLTVGSSPHTRGLPAAQIEAMAQVGIIPAYAGPTNTAFGSRYLSRDHPRIRGAYIFAKLHGLNLLGSSPHTRGLHTTAIHQNADSRIIPAYAGPTLRLYPHNGWPKDHPRIRGAYLALSGGVLSLLGSSPHTRGLHQVASIAACLLRIIPAYAGPTPRDTAEASLRWDHPRIRGAYCWCKDFRGVHLGSSPHTRGLRSGTCVNQHQSEDHPRIRGAYVQDWRDRRLFIGSSPHTRGLLSPRFNSRFVFRIIPAYAGPTSPRRPIYRSA